MDVKIKITVEKESLTYKFDMPSYDTAGKLVEELKNILDDYKSYKAKPIKKEDKRQLSLPLQDVPDSEFEGGECDCIRSGIDSKPIWNVTEGRWQCQACGGYFL